MNWKRALGLTAILTITCASNAGRKNIEPEFSYTPASPRVGDIILAEASGQAIIGYRTTDSRGRQHQFYPSTHLQNGKTYAFVATDFTERPQAIQVTAEVDGVRTQYSIPIVPRDFAVEHLPATIQRGAPMTRRDTERIQRERGLINQARRKHYDIFPTAASLPADCDEASFGARRFYGRKPKPPHSGLDCRAAQGDTVKSILDGVVTLTNEDLFTEGGTVIVNTGDINTAYLHLSEIDVQPGDTVHAGNMIARAGKTGRATGPHLHLTATLGRKHFDPLSLGAIYRR